MTIWEFLSLTGGVGLFLYGMTVMSTGLKSAAGDRLRVILEKVTGNRVMAVVIGIVVWGVLTLALQNCRNGFWVRNQRKVSLLINGVGALLFIMGSQPYAAAFSFLFLAIKGLMLIKWQ